MDYYYYTEVEHTITAVEICTRCVVAIDRVIIVRLLSDIGVIIFVSSIIITRNIIIIMTIQLSRLYNLCTTRFKFYIFRRTMLYSLNYYYCLQHIK